MLNQGQNGFDLFTHIQKCASSKFGYDNSSQSEEDAIVKSTLYHMVREMTGYDLRELLNEDGKFYTPEGEELWLELKEKAKAYSPFQLEEYQEEGRCIYMYLSILILGSHNIYDVGGQPYFKKIYRNKAQNLNRF